MSRIFVISIALGLGVIVLAAPDAKNDNFFLSSSPTLKYSGVPIQAVLANQIPDGASVGCVGFLGRIVNTYGIAAYYLYQDKSSSDAELTLNAILLTGDEVTSEFLEKHVGFPVQIRGRVKAIRPAENVIGQCSEIDLESCASYPKPTR